MQKWEYKRLFGYPSEADLNQLGKEGWELITIVTGERNPPQGGNKAIPDGVRQTYLHILNAQFSSQHHYQYVV
jgi:hypothetical protein